MSKFLINVGICIKMIKTTTNFEDNFVDRRQKCLNSSEYETKNQEEK